MSKIEFTSQQKHAMASQLQEYLESELDVEIGQFDSEFLLDYMIATFGAAIYNKGLADAQMIYERKMQTIADEIYEIEQISKF
ncbi:DUF2164 domain-containing protein [Vibrio sinensis]|uniref:DUF2164 domain-containing protein n=1 Tax=Vibrio sinensis TaxID=2302434 RepID=A0A3A6REF3_9VIBR|nr:DUF2164 domain-containing protein [Vibrio sinensis]RJX75512.1 DUF2164 domain-containing protein [Vibrio sinensis]